MYYLALSPVLGGLITPAGCTKLNSKLSIFYALAMTSFFSFLILHISAIFIIIINN
jgi:hypothetical protein